MAHTHRDSHAAPLVQAISPNEILMARAACRLVGQVPAATIGQDVTVDETLNPPHVGLPLGPTNYVNILAKCFWLMLSFWFMLMLTRHRSGST